MTSLEKTEEEIVATRALGKVAVPADLVAVIDQLKIANSIFHTLGVIEGATWEMGLYSHESRANAYLCCAMIYDDLRCNDYVSLSSYITERVAIRRELLLKT